MCVKYDYQKTFLSLSGHHNIPDSVLPKTEIILHIYKKHWVVLMSVNDTFNPTQAVLHFQLRFRFVHHVVVFPTFQPFSWRSREGCDLLGVRSGAQTGLCRFLLPKAWAPTLVGTKLLYPSPPDRLRKSAKRWVTHVAVLHARFRAVVLLQKQNSEYSLWGGSLHLHSFTDCKKSNLNIKSYTQELILPFSPQFLKQKFPFICLLEFIRAGSKLTQRQKKK